MREYEMEIDSLRANVSNARRVVILKQKGADCYVPIWIGTNEAEAIALKLHNCKIARPLTHDLLCEAIEKLGGSVSRVVITKIQDETVYAVLVIKLDEEEVTIDSRPSDAIAIAVRSTAPIYAVEDVVKNMGENFISKDDDENSRAFETNVSATPIKRNKKRTHEEHVIYPLGKEELRKLSAFSEFMESLDIKSRLENESPAD